MNRFLILLLQAQIENMRDLNVDLDCSNTDLKSAAATMEDLANIIEDVGVENLKRQLGINMSFNNIYGQY